jgi:hypothetical protein
MTPLVVGGLALVALLGVGYAWMRDHDARVRETAAALRSRDSLVVAITAAQRQATATHSADSLAAARAVAARDAALAAAMKRSAVIASQADSLMNVLAAAAPDTLAPLIARLQVVFRAALQAKDDALAAADSALAERDRRYHALEGERAADLARRDALLAEAQRQLAASLTRTSPGLVARIWKALPWAVALAGGGYLAGRLGR